MTRRWWMLIVTIVIGLTAFVLGPHIWPMAPEVPMPPANLLPGYIMLSAVEALAFGFAVAFALFGWPEIGGLILGAAWLNKWLFITLCWFMGNWWMHDSLHMHNGNEHASLALHRSRLPHNDADLRSDNGPELRASGAALGQQNGREPAEACADGGVEADFLC